MRQLEPYSTVVEIDAEKALDGVKEMLYSVKMNPKREAFIRDLNNMSPDECFNKYFPNTIRHKIEKFVRIAAVRLGIYQFFKYSVRPILLKYIKK